MLTKEASSGVAAITVNEEGVCVVNCKHQHNVVSMLCG